MARKMLAISLSFWASDWLWRCFEVCQRCCLWHRELCLPLVCKYAELKVMSRVTRQRFFFFSLVFSRTAFFGTVSCVKHIQSNSFISVAFDWNAVTKQRITQENYSKGEYIILYLSVLVMTLQTFKSYLHVNCNIVIFLLQYCHFVQCTV